MVFLKEERSKFCFTLLNYFIFVCFFQNVYTLKSCRYHERKKTKWTIFESNKEKCKFLSGTLSVN